MSKPDTVTQCRLRSCASELVSWIDSDVAVLGKRMTIDDDAIPGIFQVTFVGDTISRQALQKQESYHRTLRKGTTFDGRVSSRGSGRSITARSSAV